MKPLLHFIWLCCITNLKKSLALRGTLLVIILLTILKQVFFMISWKFFFYHYKFVHGWNFNDMLLMYALVTFTIGFVECFFYGLKEIPAYIESSELDTFLLQPKNLILNTGLSKFDVASIGEMATAILFFIYSGYFLKALPMIILVCLMGILFMFSLFLYLSCIAFFMKNASAFIRELNLNTVIIASQPNSAYQGVFKALTFSLLPVAFLSYFPIEFLRTGLWTYLWIALAGTLVFFAVACALFKIGLRRYESGHLIVLRY